VVGVFTNSQQRLSAEEVGQLIGDSRITVRCYLEYLTSPGALKTDIHYGGVGRPERRYKPESSPGLWWL